MSPSVLEGIDPQPEKASAFRKGRGRASGGLRWRSLPTALNYLMRPFQALRQSSANPPCDPGFYPHPFEGPSWTDIEAFLLFNPAF